MRFINLEYLEEKSCQVLETLFSSQAEQFRDVFEYRLFLPVILIGGVAGHSDVSAVQSMEKCREYLSTSCM